MSPHPNHPEKILAFPRGRLPKWSELDDSAGRALLEGLRELREQGRLPTWSELDDIWSDALCRAAEESLRKQGRKLSEPASWTTSVPLSPD